MQLWFNYGGEGHVRIGSVTMLRRAFEVQSDSSLRKLCVELARKHVDGTLVSWLSSRSLEDCQDSGMGCNYAERGRRLQSLGPSINDEDALFLSDLCRVEKRFFTDALSRVRKYFERGEALCAQSGVEEKLNGQCSKWYRGDVRRMLTHVRSDRKAYDRETLDWVMAGIADGQTSGVKSIYLINIGKVIVISSYAVERMRNLNLIGIGNPEVFFECRNQPLNMEERNVKFKKDFKLNCNGAYLDKADGRIDKSVTFLYNKEDSKSLRQE